jgi:hypothetical protein
VVVTWLVSTSSHKRIGAVDGAAAEVAAVTQSNSDEGRAAFGRLLTQLRSFGPGLSNRLRATLQCLGFGNPGGGSEGRENVVCDLEGIGGQLPQRQLRSANSQLGARKFERVSEALPAASGLLIHRQGTMLITACFCKKCTGRHPRARIARGCDLILAYLQGFCDLEFPYW